MYQQELHNLGLSKTQSAILDCLLEHGEQKASQITRLTKHPRGVVYKTLEELEKEELVQKQDKKNQVSLFRPTDPQNLERILDAQERKVAQNKKIFSELLPQLSSSFNLTLNKPGVKFYEGKEGLEKILYDTLTSKNEVYLMLNREAMAEESVFGEINTEYKRRRIRAGIKKKIIRIGKKPELTFDADDPKYTALTKIKYLDNSDFPFKTNIHIYDNKISFLIMEKGHIIAILIQDKNIYRLNKFWFETLWKLAKT